MPRAAAVDPLKNSDATDETGTEQHREQKHRGRLWDLLVAVGHCADDIVEVAAMVALQGDPTN